jgi:hypothetical protein
VLTEAVRRNVRTAGATDDDINDEVVRYLHGSGDREGGRAKRTSRKRLRHLRQRCEAENESP